MRAEAAWSVCGSLAEQSKWGELAEMLRHPQAHVRREAVLALTEPLAPDVVEPLAENLDVPRALTLLAHQHVGEPAKIQALLDRLGPVEQAELLICLPPEALSPSRGWPVRCSRVPPPTGRLPCCCGPASCRPPCRHPRALDPARCAAVVLSG